jgi:folate-dependent phosphoribosylglycinamide formyltransferase PurN
MVYYVLNPKSCLSSDKIFSHFAPSFATTGDIKLPLNTMTPLLPHTSGRPQAAIFLSGSGSNAEQILRRYRGELQNGTTPAFDIAALVTDAPETSRARELAAEFALPLIAEDIRKFYTQNGEKRVSIATPRGQELRAQWTDRLRKQLAPLNITFGIFAGFVPLTNLTRDFPCLNVHPGDLTYRKDGQRYLVGLHEFPIERAILEGLDYLRSSVILAGAYTGCGEDMDNGALLGISTPVPIDITDAQLEEFRKLAAERPAKRPVGGYKDALQIFASQCQDKLKEYGDWVVFPQVIWDFAANRFFIDDTTGQLYFQISAGHTLPIETIEYAANGEREVLFPEARD